MISLRLAGIEVRSQEIASTDFQLVLDAAAAALPDAQGTLLLIDQRFPRLRRESIAAAEQLHELAQGQPVISLRRVAGHPWRAFDLRDPQSPVHLLPGALARGHRQDLPPAFEAVSAVIVIHGEQLADHRALFSAGDFRGLRLASAESIRLDGPIEREMARLLTSA